MSRRWRKSDRKKITSPRQLPKGNVCGFLPLPAPCVVSYIPPFFSYTWTGVGMVLMSTSCEKKAILRMPCISDSNSY